MYLILWVGPVFNEASPVFILYIFHWRCLGKFTVSLDFKVSFPQVIPILSVTPNMPTLSKRNSKVPPRIEAHLEDAFARWISLHQHYITDRDTYIRHTMPHEYINTSSIRATFDYG